MNNLIAITGGIGAGKSVVSKILRAMGYDVYDCDAEAKRLMDSSDEIKRTIADEISRDAISVEGNINRSTLAEAVFGDARLLEKLNAAVHECVKNDLRKWADGKDVAFVETAILYESGLDAMTEEVWTVIAPDEIRIERVISRNGLTEKQVKDRIEAQNRFIPNRRHPHTFEIVNDGVQPVLPQIEHLIAREIFTTCK